MNKKLVLVVLVALVVALALTGFAVWLNQRSSDIEVNISPTTNCGADNQCFYQAFHNNCTPVTLKVSHLTTEGDPIVTSASLSQSRGGQCQVKAVVDSSQDKFAAPDQKILNYTCADIVQHDKYLSATKCSGPNTNKSTEVIL